MGKHRNVHHTPAPETSRAIISLPPDSQTLDLTTAPLVSSYNDRIRPLLDAIDKLRRLKVMQEGIHLPTIVVVGDQSSGKSSVLESLAGISLPRGQGICTRVPLIMRLQNCPNPKPSFHLEFLNKSTQIADEGHISEAINLATEEVAGNKKGISSTPLTLVVKKNGVPDLTMVDLPGITRVPVHGQPDNIYEQISDIILEYIKPEESIILNVLSATVDFPTCESIRMSQSVDKSGRRTLAVVTKADKAPEGLLEKVTADDVNIGLGYVCVRNRIGDQSYDDARNEEARLFESHPLLNKIEKSMVTIPVLAQKLVLIQAKIISDCLPEIVRKINEKLNSYVSELNRLPPNLASVSEAMVAFMSIAGSSKESLRKILLTGEFDEFPDDKDMHCTARLAEALNEYVEDLGKSAENNFTDNFLVEEIKVLEEAKGVCLPNFLSRSVFLTLLRRKIQKISGTPLSFVEQVWDYVETVVLKVLTLQCENYPQLQSSMRRAAQNIIAKMKDKSSDRVMEMIEMEKLTDYTCDAEYMTAWNKLMESHKTFMETLNNAAGKPTKVNIAGFGTDIEVGHLKAYSAIRDQAFDVKMRMASYWKIVLKRLVDSVTLLLLLNVDNLVNREIEKEIVSEFIGSGVGGIERMLEESPSIASRREKLKTSIQLLRESKDVVATIMDKIAVS